MVRGNLFLLMAESGNFVICPDKKYIMCIKIYIATNARIRTLMPQLSTWPLITFPVALHLSPYSNNEHHVVLEWVFFPHITVFCCYPLFFLFSLQRFLILSLYSILYSISLLLVLSAYNASTVLLNVFDLLPTEHLTIWLQ